ncbi:MAG: sugar phosphate isomerase/epimerase family protein [Acidobacteriaceae bacterium]
MLKAISTHIFLQQRLHAGHLDTLAKAGAEGIEIFAARQHFDYTSRQQVREIADWFRDRPVSAWALHAPLRMDAENARGNAPSINVVHVEKSRRIDAMDEVKRALESAEQIPFTHLILHLGERGDTWSPRTLEHGMTAVEHLRAFARPLGVQILLENLDRNEVAQPENLREIVSVGHFDDIDFCLDVGHAHLGDGVLPAIDTLGDRIRSVHIHDNAGDRDAHLWPGDGTIAWAETMQTLAALPKPPATVLEIHRDLELSSGPTADRLRKAFQFLDASASAVPDRER